MASSIAAPNPLTLIGNEGSPYSRKMRAVLRYRNIPHRWVVGQGPEYLAPPKVAVEMIPVLVWHDDAGAMVESMVDSTPQIERLEREYVERSLRHPDPALAFLAALIEDYADEWCSKLMFHYRWADADGVAWAGQHLIRQINPSMAAAAVEKTGHWFASRQIGRLDLVGAGAATAPLMRASYARLLILLDALVATRPFLFGARPSAADFALCGQLTQLCLYDPGAVRIAQTTGPRVVAWTQRLEDLSGWRVEPSQWLDRTAALPALAPLLIEMGATYVPYLLANAAARAAGHSVVDCDIQRVRWQQKPVSYQLKCLNWLRAHFAGLTAADQHWLRSVLAPSACSALLAD